MHVCVFVCVCVCVCVCVYSSKSAIFQRKMGFKKSNDSIQITLVIPAEIRAVTQPLT